MKVQYILVFLVLGLFLFGCTFQTNPVEDLLNEKISENIDLIKDYDDVRLNYNYNCLLASCTNACLISKPNYGAENCKNFYCGMPENIVEQMDRHPECKKIVNNQNTACPITAPCKRIQEGMKVYCDKNDPAYIDWLNRCVLKK